MARTALVIALALMAGCASHTMWVNGQPPLVLTYENVKVRVYRAGLECRIEVITATETVMTLLTRCLTVPHIPQP